jgi:pilus assembly protein TadC
MKHEDLSPEEFAEQMKEQLQNYTKLRIDLVKAQFTEKVSLLAGKLFAAIVMLFVFTLAILFVSLLAGFYFARIYDSLLVGFGIVALFYVLLFIVILIFKKRLIELPVANQIVETIYDPQDEA